MIKNPVFVTGVPLSFAITAVPATTSRSSPSPLENEPGANGVGETSGEASTGGAVAKPASAACSAKRSESPIVLPEMMLVNVGIAEGAEVGVPDGGAVGVGVGLFGTDVGFEVGAPLGAAEPIGVDDAPDAPGAGDDGAGVPACEAIGLAEAPTAGVAVGDPVGRAEPLTGGIKTVGPAEVLGCACGSGDDPPLDPPPHALRRSPSANPPYEHRTAARRGAD